MNNITFNELSLGQIIELSCPEDFYASIVEINNIRKYFTPNLTIKIIRLNIGLNDCRISIDFLYLPQSRLGIDFIGKDFVVENMYGSKDIHRIPMIITEYNYDSFLKILEEYKKK